MEINKEFVYVLDAIPTIQDQARYATYQNFVGLPVDGYVSGKSVISKEVAVLLRQAQEEFLSLGYAIVIYDGFRPQKAVDHFVRWAEDNATTMKEIYYPEYEKLSLFNGFISKKSAHTRGGAVDITLIDKSKQIFNVEDIILERKQYLDKNYFHLIDNTLDMGSSFDLFASVSNIEVLPDAISVTALANRKLLRDVMLKHGFKTYEKEWWHFSLVNEPYPDTYFNFDI